MALDDDDMTETPPEPDSGTPADRAAGSMSEDEYLGRDDDGGGADSGADGGADGGADSGAGGDDPTTETDEDSRFA
jgi:hypothetical protein